MATYEELRDLIGGDKLLDRVTTAVVIAAQTELTADPGTANGRVWALKVLRSPEAWGRVAYMTVLAANKDATVAQITGAAEAVIQSNVNDVVASLIAAEAGV